MPLFFSPFQCSYFTESSSLYCWENEIGEEMYRLLLMFFVIVIVGGTFVQFLCSHLFLRFVEQNYGIAPQSKVSTLRFFAIFVHQSQATFAVVTTWIGDSLDT